MPAFVVLISKDRIDQPLYARLWGNGFLDSTYQGVKFAAGKDPVPSFADGLQVQQVLDAVQRSAAAGSTWTEVAA